MVVREKVMGASDKGLIAELAATTYADFLKYLDKMERPPMTKKKIID
jgi:hypothetical protein